MHQPSRAAARIVSPDRRVLRVQLSELHAVFAFFSIRDRALGCAQLRIAVHDELDRRSIRRMQFLGDVRHDDPGRHLERTRIRLNLPAHEREQRRLAGPIRTDDPDLLAAIDRERRIGNEQPRTAAKREGGEGEHRGDRGARTVEIEETERIAQVLAKTNAPAHLRGQHLQPFVVQ